MSDLLCVHCDQPIDTTRNHLPDPPAHTHCWWADREQARPTPAPEDKAVRGILHGLHVLGFCWTGNVHEHAADIAEGAWRHDARWDRPGHLPWVVVSQTPCLREDLGQEDPHVDPRGAPSSHTCRLKHVHHGGRELAFRGEAR